MTTRSLWQVMQRAHREGFKEIGKMKESNPVMADAETKFLGVFLSQSCCRQQRLAHCRCVKGAFNLMSIH
jgi:hypothetical protein